MPFLVQKKCMYMNVFNYKYTIFELKFLSFYIYKKVILTLFYAEINLIAKSAISDALNN